MEKFRQ